MPKQLLYASAYAPLAPGAIVIDENIYTGLNLAERLGNPTEPIDVYVTIVQGVIVMSNDAARPALSTKGLPDGSTCVINNQGFIIGAGGRGGTPHFLAEPGPYSPEAGQPGGDALYITVPTAVASAFGYIWGGGGGGQGAWNNSVPTTPGGTTIYRFYPGAGGQGASLMGGGEGGTPYGITQTEEQTKRNNAQPFVDVKNWGRAGSLWTSGGINYAGHDHDKGKSDTDDKALFAEIQSSDTGFNGYAVNVLDGVSFDWLDNAYELVEVRKRVIGSIGTRPEKNMHWKAAFKPWIEIHIESDTVDFNLHDAMGQPGEPHKVFVYIAPGVTLTSSHWSKPAFDTTGCVEGTYLYLKNRGRIIGKGGTGGTWATLNDDPLAINPERGQDGGDGLFLTIDATISVPPLQRDDYGFFDYGMISGGGAGSPLTRLIPLADDACIGGAGGMGGGEGGRGTNGNGQTMPVFDQAAVDRMRGQPPTALIGIPGLVATRTYQVGSPYTVTSAQPANYGTSTTDSWVTRINGETSYIWERLSGGMPGWAINAPGRKIAFVCQTTVPGPSDLPASTTYATYSLFGRSTHSSSSAKPTEAVSLKPTRDNEHRVLPGKLLLPTNGVLNFNVHEQLEFTEDPVNVLVYVADGVVMGSDDVTKPALSYGVGLNRNSRVIIDCAGIIVGMGGAGGGLDGADPNAVPDYTGSQGNGHPGGPALGVKSLQSTVGLQAESISAVDNGLQLLNSVFADGNGKKVTVRSRVAGGGGGGPAIFTCQYATTSPYRFIPDTIRIGYGGGGGAGGGKGGEGALGNGSDGGRNFAFTSDNLWNDQRGLGPVLTKITSGSPGSSSVQTSFGGTIGAVGTNGAGLASFLLFNTQSFVNNAWQQSKILDVLTCGRAGAGGPTQVTIG